MNDLKVFEFDGSQVRTVLIDGEPYFVGQDVAKILGYTNPKTAFQRHCKGLSKRQPLWTPGGIQQVRVLGEADVMRLIVGSNLPSAAGFERHLFEVILPQIRRTGAYIPRASSKDQRGALRYVRKELLRIPTESYQRERADEEIQAIVADFDWLKFGVLTVARRAAGDYEVVEGGLRTRAVKQLPDIDDVPCIVFDADEIKDEARVFLDIGRSYRKINSADDFNASVWAKEEDAIKLDRILQKYGRSVRGPTPSSKIGCIATLRKLNKKWPETVQTLLPMILEIYEGKLVQQQVLTGLVVLQRYLEVVKEPSLLTMRTTLEALGPYGLHKAAVPGKNGRAQKRGPLAYAKAILTELQTHFLAYPDFQLPG